MKFAAISGDKYTDFEPVVFIQNGDKFEVLCQSFERQKYWYDYIRERKNFDFEEFLQHFTYQNVQYGDVTPDVESMLNKLRAKFMLAQVAEQEMKPQEEESPASRQYAALVRIGKRMRTGENER